MDFIITWVDGNDPKWRKEMLQHKKTTVENTSEARFRDWENLKYLFRGIEKFAPWVNKVHFVTYGHVPEWLNRDHPKLNIVKHKDYIPEKYLPTFNSHTIELNFHRIKELSEEYVYFNDDTFLIDEVKEEFFFKNGKPRDMAISISTTGKHPFSLILLSNILVLNRHFENKWLSVKKKPFNWFNLKYGKHNTYNLFSLFLNRKYYTGFMYFHLSQPFLKKTLALLWEKEPSVLDETCSHTFRNFLNVNLYLQRYWELASNNFYPINMKKLGHVFKIHKKLQPAAVEFVKNQKKPIVCLNDYDTLPEEEFVSAKKKINTAFQTILPEKSSFEV